MGQKSLLSLFFFVACAVAGPLKPTGNQCARHCTESTKLRYDPGVYTYQYGSDTITTMQGTTHDESRLHLKAQIDIEVLSKCEMAMRVRGTTLETSDPRDPNARSPASNDQEFRRSLEKNVLRFSFQDGRVESLCPTEDEEPWVLNIKRGILSTFQNSMDSLEVTQRVTETGVAGNCEVQYVALGRSWRNSVTVEKRIDLPSCTERYNIETAIQANPYDDQEPSKSLPLMEGEHVCKQTYSSSILNTAICEEKYKFKPFSKQSSGAVTRTTQKLTFSSSHNRRFAGDDYIPTRVGILFNHEEQSEERRRENAEYALTALCRAAREEIKAEVPQLFTRLVYALRKLDLSQLAIISRRAEVDCRDKKLFTDAMAMVGTTSSIQFMISLIESNRISGSDVDFWLTSLAFIPKPSTEMISALTPLLDGRYDQAILGISSLVHSFCRSNPNCASVREVREAVIRLVSNLGEGCYGRDPRKVILSLKAIGNIGQGYEAEDMLQRCYQNPQIDNEIRLAAIQAYRRFSCDVSREDLLKLYTNYKEDSELRIASYLAVMRCPTPYSIMIIKETLEKEVVNQVGSFVWTHLLNIQESTSPLKREVKDIVSNLYLLNKYHTDVRKYSRAMEGSVFSERLNMGAHMDSNIIYSPESYIPRSGMFNLTLDLFGSTVNLFEIGGRVEHLEQVVERLFGPKGYFSEGTVSNILSGWRQKRSVLDNKIDEMDGTFDVKSRYYQDPSASMYLKIFGNELWYSDIKSFTTNRNIFDLDSLLRELAKEQDLEFSKSLIFLDTTYVIPTGSGMPLRLSINGTASVGLKVGGKFDVRSIKQVDVRGRFQPSGSVEVSSLMSVYAGGAKAGLKMVATLYSSTWLDGLVEVKNGEIARIKVNMPRDKMEFIDVQSNIFLLHGENEKELKGAPEGFKRMSSCSGRYTNKLLGIELCGEVSFPESSAREDVPFFPMNGPAAARFYAQKTDRSLTSYNFEAISNREKIGDEYIRSVSLKLDTPGSSVDREIALQLELNQPEKSVSFKLRTPIKKVEATAKYTNVESQERFDLSLKVDDVEKFAIQSEFRSDRNANSAMYSPAIEVVGPNGRIFAITGSAYLLYGKKYSGQLSIEDLTAKPISIKAGLELKNSNKHEGEFSLISPYLEANLKGFVQLSGGVTSKVTVDYHFENSRREKIEFTGKIRDLSASSLTKYSGTLSLQVTAMPQYTTAATWEMQSATGHVENTINLNLGDGKRSQMHTIVLQEILSYNNDPRKRSGTLALKMKYPQKDIDYALEMKHENADRSLSNVITLQYSQGKNLMISTEGQLESNQVEGEVKLQYPGRDAKLAFNANKRSEKEYSAAIIAQWQRGRQLTAAANFKNLGDKNKMRYEADAEITLPERQPISVSTVITAANNVYSLSGDLNYGRDRYYLSGDYATNDPFNHRIATTLRLLNDVYSAEATIEGNKRKLNGDFDVKLSKYRRVKGRLSATKAENSKSGSLEIALDADRDPRQLLAVEAQVTTKDKRTEGSFTVRTNGRKINGALVCSHEGRVLDGTFRTNHKVEVEWEPNRKAGVEFKMDASLRDPRRQLSGGLFVSTPFEDYEDIVVSVNHNDDRREWSSNAELKFPKATQITLYSEGRYLVSRRGSTLNSDLKITTRYRGFERINANIQYKLSNDDLEAGGKVEWGRYKNVEVGISGKLIPGSNYKAGFNVKSHYEMERAEFSGKAEFSKTAEGISSEIEAQWDRDKKVAARALLLSRSNNNLEAKLFFTTPFRNLELFDAALSHFNSDRTFKTSLQIQHSRNLGPIIFEGEGKWVSMTDAEVKLLLTSPFENFRRISADIAHRITESNIRTVGEVIYGDKKITGELTGSHRGSNTAFDTEIDLQAITPFRGYEEIKASIVNNRRNYNFLTILQGTINRDVSKIQNSFKMVDYLNFEEDFQITSPYIRNVRVTVKQEYNDLKQVYLKHDTEARWGRNQRLDIEIEHLGKRTQYGKTYETKFSARTPFRSWRSVNLEGSYESNGKRHAPKLIFQWNESNRASLEGTLINHNLEKMEAQGTFTSTFYGYEYVFASGRYDVASQGKTAELNVKWDSANNKQIDAKGLVNMGETRGLVELLINTPFTDYETIILNGNYAQRPEDKLASLQYQWGRKKINFNANQRSTENGAEVGISFSSPYESAKQLSIIHAYKFGDDEISEETSLQWNDKTIVLDAEFSREGPKASLKATFKSPFRNYRNVMLQIAGDLYSRKKFLSAFFESDITKRYEFAAVYEPRAQSNKEARVSLRTPLRGYEEMLLRAIYAPVGEETKGEITLEWHQNKIVLDATLKQQDSYPKSFRLNLDSPFSPARNVHFVIDVVSNKKENFEINSNLEWEGVNKVEMAVSSANRDNRYYEAKMSLTTPFKNFRRGSIEGSIKNYEGLLEGKLNMVTPFKSLKNLDLSGAYQRSAYGFTYRLTMDSPKKITVTGNYENRNLKPMELKLNINTPFASLKTLDASFKIEDVYSINGQLSVEQEDHNHDVSFRYTYQNKEVEGEFRVSSYLIHWNDFALSYKLNFADSRSIEGSLTAQTASDLHSVFISIENRKEGFESVLKIDSPSAIVDGPITAIVAYSYRGDKIDFKASVTGVKTMYHLQASYSNDNNREIFAQILVKGEKLSFRSLEISGKVINSNNRVIKVEAEVSTPDSFHTVEGIVKNYDIEKHAEIKIESPLLESRSLIITGNLRNDNYQSMEGSLTAASPSQEIRVSGNMKRNSWNDFEAFATVNTPFRSLKMLRVDTKFLNDNYQNIEAKLEVQSSNKDLRRIGISGKLHRSRGIEDLSLTVKSPNRQYSTVVLLATVHYSPDFSRFSPRVTVTLPGKKYIGYANYEGTTSEKDVKLGCEWDNQKAEVAASIKSSNGERSMKVTLNTPFDNFENQELSAAYSRDRNSHTIDARYRNSRNDEFNVRSSLGYNDIANFNGELHVVTPYKDFENVNIRLRQSYHRNRLTTSLDSTWSSYKRIVFALTNEYNNTYMAGNFYLTSPFDVLRSLRGSYNVEKGNGNKRCKVEMAYNNEMIFKSDSSSIYNPSTHSVARNFVLDFPSLPLTISLSLTPLPSGGEATFKTIYPSRSVSFRSMYQITDSLFSHNTELSWDARPRHSLSYEVRVTNVQRSTRDIYARLNLPFRSFELRGKQALMQNGSSREADFYWDAARDPQKHLMVKVDHLDESNWERSSHTFTVTVSHAKLSQDIVATGKFSRSERDASGKLELVYSRYQQHKMMTEIRARNLARSNNDIHYAVYITARHPISNTDLRLTGETISTDEEVAANLKVNYLDRHRQQRLEELKAKISKLRKQIDLLAKSDEKQLRMTGRMFNSDNEFTLSLEQQQNNRPPAHSHFRLSRRDLNMDFNITTPDQSNLHVKGAMPPDSVYFEATHTKRGQTTSDVLFRSGLKNSQILTSRLTWRPELWQEIKDIISETYNDAVDVVIVTKDNVYVGTSDEFNSKADLMKRAMSQEMESFSAEIERDMDRLRYDVTEMNNEVYDAYRRNEFYAKSIADTAGKSYVLACERIGAAINTIADGVRNAYDYAKESVVNCYLYTARLATETSLSLLRMLLSFVESVGYWIEDYPQQLGRLLEWAADHAYRCLVRYAPSLETFYYDCKRKMQQLYNEASEFAEALIERIRNCQYCQAAAKYYRQFSKAISEFDWLSFFEHLDRAADAAYDYVVVYVDKAQRFHDDYLYDIYMYAYDKGSQVYRYVRLDTVMNSFAVASYQRIKSLAVAAIEECMEEYATVITGFKYEFEPQYGRILIDITLPSPKSNLREAFDLTTYPEYEKLSQLKDALLSGEDYCLSDTYYKYKLYFKDMLKLPPFDAYAMLAGNQHYITFDKFHMDFIGECSYVLSRDFVDGNFTVTVNYARDAEEVVRKSLTAIVDGKKIDIASDYKVTVDDAKVELPYVVSGSFIAREGSVVTLENERGFAVRCNFVHDLCTLHMSGYYFGKTGGMFGTYDYEPLLDMMTSRRLLVDNVDEFAGSWEVGNTVCRRENLAIMTNNDYRARRACKELFSDKDSIFRPCYKIVEPMRYYEMCLRDLARYDSSMFGQKICTSSAAYSTECNVAGVPIRMPKSCVRCEKYDGSTMTSGDVVKITESEKVQSADVVFIIEKKICNAENIKMLSKLSQSLEESLKKVGYKDIRYAVVGFGGEGVFKPPHLQTSDGQEFSNIRSISSAFTGIGTAGWSPTDDLTRNSVFEAIRYSANLPFRAGSAKTFLLLKCSECRAEEVKADYSEMLRTLLDGDITLHLLMEHEFEIKNKEKKIRVMGVDKKGAYTQKDVKDRKLSGDRDLLAQLKIPKDFCVPLALEVDGSVFASQMLTETKKNMNKKFIDIVSRRVAKSAKSSDCQLCECISTPDGIGKSVCQRCVSPVVADMISPEMMYSLETPDERETAEKVQKKKPKKSKDKTKERSRN